MTRVRRILALIQPPAVSDIELTLLCGLGLMALGFLAAEIAGGILYAPLSLLVPGLVLTLVAVTARPEKPE